MAVKNSQPNHVLVGYRSSYAEGERRSSSHVQSEKSNSNNKHITKHDNQQQKDPTFSRSGLTGSSCTCSSVSSGMSLAT